MKAMKYSKIFSVLFASKTNELLNQMRYFVWRQAIYIPLNSVTNISVC
jgi:hypothetical protein